MKAKFTKNRIHNARQLDNKETISTYNLVTHKKGVFKNPVTVRCYMGRSSQASVIYACLWVNDKLVSV